MHNFFSINFQFNLGGSNSANRFYAILSAIFAALTAILAKVGIEGVNSNLATAIRTLVVLLMAWGMVWITHSQSGLPDISRKSWIFLILAFIFLHEEFTMKSLIGCVLIGIGTLLMVL